MTSTSCISFPPKDRMIIIRHCVVTLCTEADKYHKSASADCAAAILQYFVYRTDSKLDQQIEWKTECDIASKSDQPMPPYPELWIFKSQDELYQVDMLSHFGRNCIVYSLRWLVEASPYLTERQNPKYTWDKTKQYRLNIHAIQVGLESLPVNYREFIHGIEFNSKQSESLKVNDGEFNSKRAIPKYISISSSAEDIGSPKVEPSDGAENANDELDLYGIRIYDKNGKRLNSFQYIVAGINTHLFKGDNLGLAKKFASVLKENNFEPTGAEMQGYPIWYAALSPIDGEPREPIQSHLKFPSSWGEYIEWRKEHPDQAPEAAAAQGDTTSHEQRESAVPTIPTVLFAQMEDTYYDD